MTEKRSGFSESRFLAAILLSYAVLAISYSVLTPIIEPYDEYFHFSYVLQLALTGQLPVQDVENPGPWGNEGSQPPLYYALAAGATFWTVEPNFDRRARFNPHATRHLDVEFNDNKNIYIHRRTEQFPYQGNVLAIHIARLISICFGLGALGATYLSAKQFAPTRPELALGATAFQAFIPSFIYVSSAVSNDAVVICLAAWSLWLSVRIMRQASVSMREALMLGLLIGFATLAKLSALPLVAVAALALLWVGGVREGRTWLLKCMACGGAFFAVTAWWFVRNKWLYDEWLGTDTMNRIAGLRPAVASWAQLMAEWPQVERTFWAAFGTGNVHPDPLWLWYPRLLTFAGLLGCGLALRREFGPQRRLVAIVGLWVCVFLISFVWWWFRITSVTGRLLFPLLTPFVLMVVFGLSQFVSRLRPLVVATSMVGMVIMAVAMPITVISPAYAWAPTVNEADLARVPQQANLSFGELFRLRAYHLRETIVKSGVPLHVELYWQALRTPSTDYSVFTRLMVGEQVLGGRDTLPARGNFPTTDWTAGAIYHDVVPLYLEEIVQEPVVADVIVGWYETQTQNILTPRTADGKRTNRVSVGRVRVEPTQPLVMQPQHQRSANFADQIELIGYDLSSGSLTLYWRVLRPLDEDYTVFVHVLDAAGQLLGQADGPPRNGDYPTSFWKSGEVVRDVRALKWPTNYAKVLVGWYRLQSGERLGVSGQHSDVVSLFEK